MNPIAYPLIARLCWLSVAVGSLLFGPALLDCLAKPFVVHRTPEAAPTTLPASLERWDGGSGSLAISNGVIFAEGDVTEEMVTDRKIQVWVDGVEQAVYTEALDGRWPDGSVKSVLVQFANTFTGTETAEIVLGTVRGTTDLTIQTIQPHPDGLLYLTDPDYLCEAFPLWWDILPEADHPTTPDAFGIELDSFKTKYETESGQNWDLQLTLGDSTTTSLTTRTSDTVGALTRSAGQPPNTGELIDITWTGGARYRVVCGTVSGNDIPISGGTGDNLPAEATAIKLFGSYNKWNTSTVSATYDYGQHAYSYYAMTGDAEYLYRAIYYAWYMSDGIGDENGWVLQEWHSNWQATMLLHYWLTGYDDSRTAPFQFVDGTTWDPADWSDVDADGNYSNTEQSGRMLASHIKSIAVVEHLGGQGTIPAAVLSSYATNALKARAYVDNWIAQQETDGSRRHGELSWAVCTLSGVTGTFEAGETLTVGGTANKNILTIISGSDYTIKRNNGLALVTAGQAIVGQTSGATATVATVGTPTAGTQPWQNMLAGNAMIVYDRWISTDRQAEIKECIEKDYEWMDSFWDAGTNDWPIYDTNGNGNIVPSGGDPDLNSFALSCLDWLIEQETDGPTKAAYISRGEEAIEGMVDGGEWYEYAAKQLSEMQFGTWPFIYRRAAEE